MSNFEKALSHISEQMKEYRETEQNDGETMTRILQQISSTLFYLEKERAVYHESFQKTIHKLVLSGESVSRAENQAHVIVPEIYLLRRIMDSGYKVCDSIRTQVSWIKSGLNNG